MTCQGFFDRAFDRTPLFSQAFQYKYLISKKELDQFSVEAGLNQKTKEGESHAVPMHSDRKPSRGPGSHLLKRKKSSGFTFAGAPFISEQLSIHDGTKAVLSIPNFVCRRAFFSRFSIVL
jgi:hypothetical protein